MFTRVCFGLSSAPQIFTKVIRPVFTYMRTLGVKIFGYIDDFYGQDGVQEPAALLNINASELLGIYKGLHSRA